jgi:hypothetical protein
LPGIGAFVGKGEVELKLPVCCAEARREKLATQLPMMDFILNGEVAVVVEGWVLCSRKGAAHTFLYSQVTLRVSSSRLNKTVEHDAKGQGRPYLDQSILSPAASARQYPRSMMQPTKTEAVVAVMQFGKPYKVGQARQRKGPITSKTNHNAALAPKNVDRVETFFFVSTRFPRRLRKKLEDFVEDHGVLGLKVGQAASIDACHICGGWLTAVTVALA